MTETKTDPADAMRLTEREHEIVDLAIAGLTAREISNELGLSFHTVRTHIRNVYDKTGSQPALS